MTPKTLSTRCRDAPSAAASGACCVLMVPGHRNEAGGLRSLGSSPQSPERTVQPRGAPGLVPTSRKQSCPAGGSGGTSRGGVLCPDQRGL